MLNNKLPRVTVLIANYNYAKYIGDAIRSVAESDYPNINLMIVDDASTDDSWKIIKLNCNINDGTNDIGNNIEIIKKKNICYTGKIDKIPVFAYRFDKNQGPGPARNLGIKLVWNQMELIKPLDADDMLHPNCISTCVAKFLEDPDIGGVYSNYQILNMRTGNIVPEYKEPFSLERLYTDCHIHSSCMISKIALQETSLYPPLRVCEDYGLFAMISKKRLFVHVPKILMTVRSHGQDTTSSVPVEIWNQCRAKVGEILQSQ